MDSLVKNGTSEDLVDTCQNDEPLSTEAAATDEKKRSVTFPKYRYNRDELLALRGARHSRMKPRKLSKEFELEDQKWDPDKWFYNIDRSADTQMQKPEKPLPRIPRTYNTEETVYDNKKSGGDFKRTLISSIGDSENIVLGPQRNSFTTGCNAARATTKRDASPRRDGKERSHRIGSGRVQVGDRRSEKPEYESNERRGGGGGGSGGVGRYDNEWKDDRYSRRGDRRDGNSRGWTNQRDRSSEGVHRNDHRYAMVSRSHTEATSRGHAPEPEWFTRGPSSRNDVIELRGFGRRSDDGDVEAEKAEATRMTNVAGSGDSIQRKTEAEKESSGAGKKRNATSAHSESNQEKSNRTSVGERRAVTSETGTRKLQDAAAASDDVDARDNSGCSAAEAGQTKAQEFDFNDFFKDSVLKLIEPESVHEGSSRFKAFFNLQPSSRSTDYLEAIVDGHNQSPLPASPPIYGHRLVGSDEAQEKKRFLMMLEKANLLSNEDAKNTYFDEGKQKEFTADLKGILKVTSSAVRNARGAEPQNLGRKVLPSGSKPLLAEELEANLLTDVSGKKAEQNLPHRPATSLPIGSKVTTLAELEGSLMASKDDNQPQGHADNPDMSAFNKLLDFVQGVGKPPDQTTVNSGSSQNAVFTTANSDLPSTLLKSIEQLGSSALDEPSGCPSLAMSLSGHQVRIQNRPVSPVTSSPIMFGTQPPTNLMMPQARRQIQQGQPTSAPGVGFVVRPSQAAQRNSFVPEGTSVLGRPLCGLAPPSVAASGKIVGGQENWSPPRHGQFVPDAGRSNEVLATDAAVADANAKQRTEAGKVSQSFTPTVVMRKMISERAASRNAGDKTNLLASDQQLSQDLMDGTTASNESRYSNSSAAAGGVSHVATAGLSAASSEAAALNSQQQQATALQQNQILQMIKNHLSMSSSSNSLPPHQQQMVDGGSSSHAAAAASRGYLPSMGYPAQQQHQQPFLTQMVGGGVDHVSSARWQATGNKHALDIMAQLRSQGQGQSKAAAAAAPAGSGYLPYRSLTGAGSSQQQQQQQQSMLAPADMAAILLQRLQNSTGQPMSGARPPTNLPMAPPPIGRAIVKGTGMQPQTHQTNQTNPLAAIQAMMLQQQHQHPASVVYPGMPGPGGALVPGTADHHWSSAPQPTTGTAVNSVHMNGGTGIHGNSTASLSNGNYDAANLSRLFGESFLRHPQVASMSSFQGHKTTTASAATMMTVDDLERRYASLGASKARLS